MPRTEPFDRHAAEYDDWFDRSDAAYRSELAAVRALLPEYSRGVEIGVGTGRFASALGIALGVEPSAAMARLARSRGVRVIEGVAERLPLEDAGFDLVLFVTTLCFVDDVGAALGEARRILVEGGHLVVGFLDRETELGRVYEARRSESPFYASARFLSSEEVLAHLRRAGFGDATCVQTIFEPPGGLLEPSAVEPGHGRGLFVVARARKAGVAAGSAPSSTEAHR